MSGDKNPRAYLFWNDLEHDAELKMCSLSAKGLWTCHLLPIAARSPEPGVVMIGTWPCRVDADLATVLSNTVGGSPDVLSVLIGELVSSGAASIDEQGRLYNRRMVRERKLSETRSQAGKTGAAARWQTDGKHHGKRDGKTEAPELPLSGGNERDISDAPSEGGCEGDGKPMPSSFLPFSKEDVTTTSTVDRGRAERAKKPGRAERKSKLPEDWSLSDKLRAWTVDTLAATHAAGRVDIEHQFRKFKAHHLGKATMWVRWDQAWQTWIWNAIDWSDPNGKTRTHDAKPQRGSAGTRAAHGYAVYAAAGAGQLAKRRPPGDDDPA